MDTTDYLGLVVYTAFLVGAVFLGPLEAALGLAAHWLFGPDETADSDGDGPVTRGGA